MQNSKKYLVTAAGGNGTIVELLKEGLSRAEYAKQGKILGRDFEPQEAEQAGFLIPIENRFEMAGGEFCGNAARSTAVLLSIIKGLTEVEFTVSGFIGTVKATVIKIGGSRYTARCTFGGLPVIRKDVCLKSGQEVSVVDLGGIVHVVFEAPFPVDKTFYQNAHLAMMRELELENREAVGVVWFKRQDRSVFLYPVVWVKEVDTFFFEQSCGSGTIAVALVTGAKSVVQPTGKTIEVEIMKNGVVLESEMEVTYES
ncbi:MAG: hypothetical protein EXS46_01095 [Candidatus Taylorbacteria bacterium]|nr:hypothetical protein [Candidatus Taylorbacteria bacterium]